MDNRIPEQKLFLTSPHRGKLYLLQYIKFNHFIGKCTNLSKVIIIGSCIYIDNLFYKMSIHLYNTKLILGKVEYF